jgi:hypothetical protein
VNGKSRKETKKNDKKADRRVTMMDGDVGGRR